MKRLLWVIGLFSAFSSFAAPETSETWDIDKNHTSVSFDVGHLGISKVRGLLNVTAGSITTDPKDLSKTTLEVTIDANSLNTAVAARDKHVKSADFLDTATYPTITFKSTAVREDKAKHKIYIDGNLTLKGKTNKVTLEANPISDEVKLNKDGTEKIVRATLASTTINRYDYDINYGKNDPLSKLVDGGISKEITISISTEFIKKNSAAPTGKK